MKRSKPKQQLMDERNDARRRFPESEAVDPLCRIVGEAVRAAQARLQQLLLSSPAVVYACKPGGDYGVTFISENVTPQLGYDSREFIEDSAFWVNRIHPEDAPAVLSELTRLFEVGDYVHEYRFLHKDGTYRWMRDESRLVRDGDGNPSEIVGFWIDITERKRIEEALRESEATARALLDAPDEVVILLDTNGVILDANEATAVRFNKTREDLVGLSIWELLEPDTAARRKAFVDRVIRSGEPIQFEDEREGKWWDSIKYPIRDSKGKVTRVAVFARDITKRKLAEDALRNSERRLADIINFLPDATFAIDRERRVLAWNQAMEEMTGVKAGEILGKGNCEYGIPFYGERRPLLADLLLKPDQAHEGQYTVIERHQDTLVAENFLPSLRGGTYLWAKARLLYDSQGTVVGAIESMRDITALKQAERALRESGQAYRNIIENAVEGIFQATPEGRYLSVNPAWANMCGFSSPEEMIREVRDIASQLYVNPEDRTRIKRLYDEPGFVKGFEAQFRRKDGGLIWVSITARSVRDEGGALLYYEGTIQDITKRKRAEIKLEEYQKQLRSLASELSLTEERGRRRLATDLHDSIGQTLAMCKLKLDELRSQGSLAVLANDLDHIATLLDRAIQGTRSLTFELSPPVLYELGIEAALESLVERMQQVNGTQIKLIAHGGSKPLTEDIAALCFRAVQELLVNVIKHADARKIEVSTRRDRGRIRITVADDGIGFDPREIISRKGGKGGFGLFSIRERLQHLGGSLKVDSKLGQGTRVTLSAPLRHRLVKRG
jgi:PAS domain S-box-containing protein